MEFVRLDPRAAAPERMTSGAAGFDLRACLAQPLELIAGGRALVPTGLSLAIPAGFEGQIRPRSGLALTHGLTVLNAPGTIDSDYRGPLGILLINLGQVPCRIEHGERIAQLIIAPVTPVEFLERSDLASTERGKGGFGHTGRS
ncbi:MAG: dUTP diphosphatase [Candidatus Eisenbacteria bacterium]|nr:dUTP diphosphatase [Candidatus Eisenbacteria bacterium]